jgi:hypothetical protein
MERGGTFDWDYDFSDEEHEVVGVEHEDPHFERE